MAGKKYIISIPKPCHQGWEHMTLNEKDRFCDACRKNVIDFTHFSDAEIVGLIEKSNGRLCGRVSRTQLNREIYIEKYNTFIPIKARLIGGLLALATLQPVISYASKPAMAEFDMRFEEFPKPGIKPFVGVKNEIHDTTRYMVKGIVLDSLTNEPIPFANVLVVGTNQGVNTDMDGKFELEVSKNTQLKIICIGYETYSFTVTRQSKGTETPLVINKTIKLNGAIILGEMIIIEKTEKQINTIKNPTEAETRFLLNR